MPLSRLLSLSRLRAHRLCLTFRPGLIGFQPAPAALSAPPPGPVGLGACRCIRGAADFAETLPKTGFDPHGNPAATPGQKKPFLLDPLLQ